MTEVKVGVIGYGYWGPNLVRNFGETPNARVSMVSDLRDDRLALVQARNPSIRVTKNPDELIRDPEVDAVIISTPVSSHYDLALSALKAGKHVLVEKPLTRTAAQAADLIAEAEKRKLLLMVDHTFIYTGAIRKIHDLLRSDEVGDIYYFDSVRVNLGLFQHDVSVLWDLAVHDLSIMSHIIPEKPVAVSATASAHLKNTPEDVAYLTLFFDSSLIAHVHVNWLAPVKIRRTLIGCSRKMIVYDDLEPSEKVKVYDKGITVRDSPEDIYRLMIGYRSGDMLAPQIDGTEALKVESRHFLDCIAGSVKPQTGGEAGLQVVKILEAATLSIQGKGTPVYLDTIK